MFNHSKALPSHFLSNTHTLTLYLSLAPCMCMFGCIWEWISCHLMFVWDIVSIWTKPLSVMQNLNFEFLLSALLFYPWLPLTSRHYTCKDFTTSFASNSSLWSISSGYITCRQWKWTWNWNEVTLYESDESQTATNEVYSITPKLKLCYKNITTFFSTIIALNFRSGNKLSFQFRANQDSSPSEPC